MASTKIVTQEEYRPLRLTLLEKEKQLTRARDELNAERRKLPLVEVTTPYTFTTVDAAGNTKQISLAELFGGRAQLIIYHFMFNLETCEEDKDADADADAAGCPSCSLYADHIPRHLEHLHSHGTSFAAVSRAPINKIERYKKRMGWTFPWVSSHGTRFNYDFHVTQDPQVARVEYNFKDEAELGRRGLQVFTRGDQPGHSVFVLGGEKTGVGEQGKVYHSYSTYARGGEHLIGTLSWLDMTPLGRQDGVNGVPGLGYKRHDEYTKEDLDGLDLKIGA
ncbi:hypothetical protein PV05_04288 [Exophiala xenobiotica]|uniref:DUF899 domain-containing protein n=1 Tax=Exophiala xenobiotica TaxID=348802 RepID=A0A0D2CZK9_9EURO|nr:uncharacterized protein PV05_04288 [Exophiala xenobiotica]KIW55557.1 hypothetical protein PV05_04288 [Exophiala xenobiotica]